ncbi:MAG TPA: PGF-pre-PGF domain-containing protein [Methanocorpusculum sp.]|nr:PGF-pre-PGF domain-containing protein [Methanocorpusculum sp.]
MKRDFTNRYEKSPLKAILLSMLIIFICAAAFCGCVSAEDTTKEVSTWEELCSNLSKPGELTVKLTADVGNDSAPDGTASLISIKGTKILDLNGHKITATDNNKEKQFVLIDVFVANLTVRDTSGEETGSIELTAKYPKNACSDVIRLWRGHELIIENGKIIHNGGCYNFTHAIEANTNGDDKRDTILIVKGGSIISNGSDAIRSFVNSPSTDVANITIEGGNIYGKNCGIYIKQHMEVKLQQYNLTITGGTITGGKHAIGFELVNSSAEGKTTSAIINGGKLINEDKTQPTIYYDVYDKDKPLKEASNHTLTINDGVIIRNDGNGLILGSVHPITVNWNDKTPLYPGLNHSNVSWTKSNDGWTAVIKDNNTVLTFIENIANLKCLDLSEIDGSNTVTIQGTDHIVKVVKDEKYSFDGWSNGAENLPANTEIFYGKKVYTPIFTYIKQYGTGEEVEDDEPTPTIEPTPIVTPTPTQNQTAKPTVKPTPEPKTVVIVETEVKFEDNKVITSITVPEGSSGSITFTQTEEKGMDEWIPESIEDTYSFDLSCDGEINGDSEIHFVMSDTILKSLGLTPEDVCLKHFENGVWVKLKISYIVLDDGTYYYTAITKSFSPFEISFDGMSEEPTVTPTEEQPKSPMPVLGLLMGLGAAALVLRRK